MSAEPAIQKIRRYADDLVVAARSDPAMAAQLVGEIESIATEDPQPLFQAYSHRAQGHLLQIHGRINEAVERYRVALNIFGECREPVERARTASSLVGVLAPLGEFDEALRLAEEAREIFQESNLQLRAARLDVNLGNLYHRLNRLEEALARYDRAAPLLRNSEDREAAGGVLINRSVMLMLLYRFEEALEGFLQARAFSEQHGLSVFATQSDYNRAYLLFLIGDYGQALKLMQAAEAAFQKIGDLSHVAHCRLDRAEILLELNLPEYAYELAGQAESGFRSSGLNGDRSRSLLLLGRSLMRLSRTDEAITHFVSARQLFDAEDNAIWTSMADLEIAAALMAHGQESQAAELIEQAGDLFRSQKHYPFSALADALGARLCIKVGQPERALFFVERCQEFLKAPAPAFLRYHLEYLRARALEQLGHKKEARETFRRAVGALEFLLAHISVDQAMVRFLEDKEDVYEHLAVLCDDVREALMLVDRARTRALTTARNLREGVDRPSEKVRALRENLRSDHLRLFQVDQSNSDALFEKIKLGEQQLMQEMLDEGFRHAESSAHRPFDELDDLLDQEEVVLEYFLKDEKVSVFVVKKGLLEVITLPITASQLHEEVNFTRYGLSKPGDARREAVLRCHLRRLYAALIEPVNHLLTRRAVIVPHRFLHHLPFQVLLSEAGYAADEYVISYAPSIAAYAFASRKQSRCSASSLIIGSTGSDLPAITNEVTSIAAELPNCRIAFNQSLPAVRSDLETAAFVHVASHGLFRTDSPFWSLLNLGSDVLTPADMLNLEVNAELVTMSACSTGQAYVSGNEVHGFVRAFSMWGVPSVIGSLWDVDDRATAMLMSSLYRKLRHSPDIAENLSSAMSEVRREFPHPYYWGGFVLIGRQRLGASWDYLSHNRKTDCTDLPDFGT